MTTLIENLIEQELINQKAVKLVDRSQLTYAVIDDKFKFFEVTFIGNSQVDFVYRALDDVDYNEYVVALTTIDHFKDTLSTLLSGA